MNALILFATFTGIFFLVYGMARAFSRRKLSYEELYLSRAEGAVRDLDFYMPADRLAAMKMGSAFLFGIAAFTLTVKLPLPLHFTVFIVAAVVGSLLPDAFYRRKLHLREKEFNDQLIDTMTAIANGLQSGFSFQQSLELAAQRLPDPSGQEFRIAIRENRLGVRLPDALQNMVTRLRDPDLQLMVTAIRMTLEIGGDLENVLGKISETLRERRITEGKVKALTSQGRLQALIAGIVPFALAWIVHIVDPSLVRVMYTTPIGWSLLSAVVVLDILGYFLIRRIVSVRY